MANPVILNTKELQIKQAAPIESKQLNLFSNAVAEDLGTLQDAINNYLIPLVNGLPDLADESIDAVANTQFDGSQLYVDKNADTNSDNGLFYDADAPDGLGGNGRPITIKEALLTIIQLIARNAGSNYSEDTENITVTGTDVSNGYVQLSDSNGIIDSNTTFKVYYAPSATDGYRLPSTEFSVDTATKRISPDGSFSLVSGDKIIVDYATANIILP